MVVGFAAAKAIREGDPLLATDLRAPVVVKKGEMVRVRTEGRGWVLDNTVAKALGDAAVNETVTVEVEVEKKRTQYSAVVTGPGRAWREG